MPHPATIRVFITDDHEMARFALETWIEADSGTPPVSVIGSAARGSETLNAAYLHEIDLFILDIDLPDMTGLDLTRALREQGFRAGILCMSGSHLANAQDVLRAGANGFVSKEESHAIFLEGIRWIAETPDSVWLSPHWHRQQLTTERVLAQSHLTPAEQTVLRHIRLSNKEIAEKLTLSESTVKNHLSAIFQKLGVSSRQEAAGFAAQTGLIPPR